MIRIARFIIKPHCIVFFTVLLSFLAWIYPYENIRRGFQVKESLSLSSGLVIFLWYGLIILFSYVGYKMGKKVKRIELLNNVNDQEYYKVFTFFSIIGVFGVFATIIMNAPNIVDQILLRNGNYLKEILYNNYSVGLHSLRYVSILSGAIAISKILINKKVKLIDLINIIMLLMTALISSRLAIVIAALIVIGILVKHNKRISMTLLLLSGGFLFVVLAILNYTRNANFYNNVHGIYNPFLMNISEIVTYLGAPFQATVGVANNLNHINEINQSFESFFYLILPTFFHGPLNINIENVDKYREFIDIENVLSTNSAFVFLFENLGYYTFVFIPIVICGYSFIVGHFLKYNNYLYIIGLVVIYCFAELWRIYLFNAGIIFTLIFIILFTTILLKFVKVRIKIPRIKLTK